MQVKENVCVFHPGFSIGFLLWLTNLTVDLVSAILPFICAVSSELQEILLGNKILGTWNRNTFLFIASQPQLNEISGRVFPH